jgi:hypothetical protein
VASIDGLRPLWQPTEDGYYVFINMCIFFTSSSTGQCCAHAVELRQGPYFEYFHKFYGAEMRVISFAAHHKYMRRVYLQPATKITFSFLLTQIT